MSNRITIGIEEDALTMTINGDFEGRRRYTDWQSACNAIELVEPDDVVMLSSSVDFPEDSTDEKWLLDLAAILSGCD